jgi:hypothetical protein
MVFLKEGSPDSEKGNWIQAGIDPDNKLPIKLRIRSVPQAKARAIRESYGREETVQSPVKIKQKSGEDREFNIASRDRIHSEEDRRCSNRDFAEYALVDCENLSVLAIDEAKAKVYSALLPGVEVKPNDPVTLDGRLTEAFKHYLLDNDVALVNFINEKATELGTREYGKEARLTKT